MEFFKRSKEGGKLLIVCGLFLLSSVCVFSSPAKPAGANEILGTQQDRKISGQVVDDLGEPVVGANIVVKGNTGIGTVTDIDGNFSLSVPAGSTITVSYIGYSSQDIVVGNQTSFAIKLLDDTQNLEEIVVVGYGTQKKSDLTGSISSISSDRLMDKPAFNVAQAISGKIAGVKINERTGAPGGNSMIRIRGTNSINSDNQPLVVIDGVAGVQNALDIMNPSDIQSIEVLKDASATAIYGSRGANGVIMVTTKRGSEGKVSVTYDGTVSANVMRNHVKSLNAEEFMYVYTQAWANSPHYTNSKLNYGAAFDASFWPSSYTGDSYSEMPFLFQKVSQGAYSVPLIGKDGGYYAPIYDTDWENELFGTSMSTNHNISIRGGNDWAKVGTFLGYSHDDGLLKNTFFERYTARLTGDFKVTNWFEINSSLGIVRSKNRKNDSSGFSGGLGRGVIEQFSILPTKYPSDVAANTTYNVTPGIYGRNLNFPVGEVDVQSPLEIVEGTEQYYKRNQWTGNLALIFHLTDDLTFRTTLAADNMDYRYYYYQAKFPSRGDNGRAEIRTRNYTYWQNENYFNYDKIFGDHTINAMVGASWSKFNYEDARLRNYQFYDDFYKYHNVEVGTYSRPPVNSEDYKNTMNSYFARVNYNYKSKYLATFTGRIDGSSKFGKNNKYGFFPSGSLAWRVSEEDFLKDNESISNLKLRASAGITGNQEIGNQVTQAFLSTTNIVLGGAIKSGLYPSSMASPDLKWEKNIQYDAGFDLGLFKSRVILVFDVYYKKTTDMLLEVPMPVSTTPSATMYQNYGELSNKGVEVTVNLHTLKSKDFNWYTDIAVAHNKNEILRLGPSHGDILKNSWVGGANTILREGEAIASFYGLTRLGTFSTREVNDALLHGFRPGDVKYLDLNGDGAYTLGGDAAILGNGFPKWDLDFNNTFEYKNFDLQIDLKASLGGKIQNRTNHSGEDRQTMGNSKRTVLGAWRPDNQNTDIAAVRACNAGAYYQTWSDTHWIENASYLRGDGLTLGYTLPKNALKSLGLQNLRMYLNAKNFFVITKYSGYDPEASDSGNMDSLTPNMDFYSYPRPMVITFGVNVGF